LKKLKRGQQAAQVIETWGRIQLTSGREKFSKLPTTKERKIINRAWKATDEATRTIRTVMVSPRIRNLARSLIRKKMLR
jgi:hypothetical protein